ncbi:hypothetical protein [Sphingomonas sp. NPDC079357]|jgi:hypothetical protein|uniref:hypothetical protein n=1 Tax=Sphingomonas sp. NPDC079357 TaxID=3364518 RepID=UPI00384EE789
MQRRLVLTNEGAGHPFRRTLPPPPVATEAETGDHDVRLFLLSFAAFFVTFSTMIF